MCCLWQCNIDPVGIVFFGLGFGWHVLCSVRCVCSRMKLDQYHNLDFFLSIRKEVY